MTFHYLLFAINQYNNGFKITDQPPFLSGYDNLTYMFSS